MNERRKKKLGEILVAQGLIEEKQLIDALHQQKMYGGSLGAVIVKLGFISEDELSSVLGQQIQLNQKKRIGEVLIEQGFITEEQLQAGLKYQKEHGVLLGKALVQMKVITDSKLIDVLSAQLDVQRVKLSGFNFSPKLIREIPEDVAKKYKVIPLFENNNVITVAMADPTNLRTIDHLKFKTGKDIDPVIATESSILSAIDEAYKKGAEQMEQMLGEMDVRAEGDVDLDVVDDADDGETLTDEEGQQVVKVVNLIVTQAIGEGASDIHLEPMEKYYRLRYRIDGELVEKNPIPLQMRAQIISRLKIMAGMDISEKRKPQDGHFQIRYQGRSVDLRVSTFPAMTRNRGVNEKMVLRIIDQDGNMLTLDQLGFLPNTLKKFDEQIKRPDGILLVTGPTGSGKSSTLYASLVRISEFYKGKKNIVTMEDPVESSLDGINQGQINVKAGFTFAAGMRSILRQDPDIVMVGEMRDKETAQMAVQAALTGHMVFSTLHTNDSPSTYTRLFDMGIEPFLVASTVVGILAQRLVRRICSHCKEEYEPDPEILAKVGLKPGVKMYRGKGCKFCGGKGYAGRQGLYEFLVPDHQIERMLVAGESSDKIKAYLLSRGDFDTLRRDGLRKVLSGNTTLEQVLAGTQDD